MERESKIYVESKKMIKKVSKFPKKEIFLSDIN